MQRFYKKFKVDHFNLKIRKKNNITTLDFVLFIYALYDCLFLCLL